MLLLLILFYLALALFGVFAIVAAIVGVPSLPTHQQVVDEVMHLAEIKRGDVFMDLGCGTGRVLIAAAKQGAISFGWDINPLMILWAKVQTYRNRLANKVSIQWGDYSRADVKQADIIFLFLMRKHMKALEPRLQKELRKGTKVFAYIYPFPNLKPDKVTKSGIYCYIF